MGDESPDRLSGQLVPAERGGGFPFGSGQPPITSRVFPAAFNLLGQPVVNVRTPLGNCPDGDQNAIRHEDEPRSDLHFRW